MVQSLSYLRKVYLARCGINDLCSNITSHDISGTGWHLLQNGPQSDQSSSTCTTESVVDLNDLSSSHLLSSASMKMTSRMLSIRRWFYSILHDQKSNDSKTGQTSIQEKRNWPLKDPNPDRIKYKNPATPNWNISKWKTQIGRGFIALHTFRLSQL